MGGLGDKSLFPEWGRACGHTKRDVGAAAWPSWQQAQRGVTPKKQHGKVFLHTALCGKIPAGFVTIITQSPIISGLTSARMQRLLVGSWRLTRRLDTPAPHRNAIVCQQRAADSNTSSLRPGKPNHLRAKGLLATHAMTQPSRYQHGCLRQSRTLHPCVISRMPAAVSKGRPSG